MWRIAPLGGVERKVAEIQPRLGSFQPSSLAWCPDSTCVLVTDSPGPDQADAVFAIAIDTGEKRQLTRPHGLVRDADAAISPDGRHLIFRRDTTPFSGQFFRVSLDAGFVPDGEPVPMTEMLSAGKAAWTPDGREILFGSRGALWRLNAMGGGTPVRLSFVGQDGLSPVVVRTADRRQRLVYVRSLTDVNVWRITSSCPGRARVIAAGDRRCLHPGRRALPMCRLTRANSHFCRTVRESRKSGWLATTVPTHSS